MFFGICKEIKDFECHSEKFNYHGIFELILLRSQNFLRVGIITAEL